MQNFHVDMNDCFECVNFLVYIFVKSEPLPEAKLDLLTDRRRSTSKVLNKIRSDYIIQIVCFLIK